MDYSRSPRGERGLKSLLPLVEKSGILGRSPRGERGLKYGDAPTYPATSAVAPLAGSVD